MKKRGKKSKGFTIHIHLSNRWLYTLIAIGLIAVFAVIVYAYGTSNPSTFGHSVGELNFSEGINGDLVVYGNVIANDPIADNQLATKAYVDALGGASCSLTNCGSYSVPSDDWRICPSSRPIMAGVDQSCVYGNCALEHIRCCAITCS